MILENKEEWVWNEGNIGSENECETRGTLIWNWLTLFFPMFPFDPPCKHQKTKGFLMFSGGSERNIGKEMVRVPQVSMNTIFNFNSDKIGF